MQARRRHLLYSALIALVVFALSGCTAAIPAGEAPAAEAPAAEAPAAEVPAGLEELIAAAQAEGELTTIALPRDWCNYGEMIDAFSAQYGIKVNELDPNAGSGDELEAIKANKDNKGPQAPDVIDVGFAFGPQAVEEGLLQPYKVSTWDTIPESAKDPDGYWYGDYYGVMAFLVNKDVVAAAPQSWLDLAKPEYNGQAASLANGGTLADPTAGLELMAQVNQAGNLVPVIALPGTVALGETPITAVWDYNALSWADGFEGNPATEVVIPTDGRIAGVYLQGISAYAPHPNAAKLWMEYLYSDEGQLTWMEGYCRPIREADLRERGVIPEEIAAKIPDASGVVFPTLEELVGGKQIIVDNWDTVVGADVQAAQ
jgi:putative spermidine/putrescine transport system substrate-binding protein